MKWLRTLFMFGYERIKEDRPYNPDCYGTVDMNGRFYLRYKDEAAVRKHFKRQFDAAERLAKQLNNGGSPPV